MQTPMRFDPLSGRRFVPGQMPVLTRMIYALTALACLVGLSGAMPSQVQAASDRISPNLARQLKAALQEKQSRTPAQQKIDPSLLMAIKQQRGESVPYASRSVAVAGDGTVVVEIKCPVTDNMMDEAIEAMGGQVLNRYPRYDMIRASMPLSQIETLASKSVVRSVRQPIPWVTRQGSVVTKGDAAHRADEARSTFNLDGSGGKICAISDGGEDLAARQAAGELPADDVEVLEGQEGVGSEGTALLEIIHDMAPGAYLGFATALFSPEQFATNIRDLRNEIGCDVIVDDVGYLNQSPFQPGVISEAIADVVADGAVYFTAAGNDGSLAKGTSGTFEGDFEDSGEDFEDLFGDELGLVGSLHNFPSGGASNVGLEILNSGFAIAFHWADPFGASDNDYDVCLTDEEFEQLIACSLATQDGDDDPFEFIGDAPAGSQLVIFNFADNADTRFMHAQVFGGMLEEGTSGSIFGHPGFEDAIAVGAADVNQAGGGPFTEDAEVEGFSSDGPRRIFFEADGTPFTPGDLTSTVGVVRQKPDIAAADGVRTTTPGFQRFFGTSAAAPHAAAVAGLMLQADPTLSPTIIEDILEGSAVDIEESGFEYLRVRSRGRV